RLLRRVRMVWHTIPGRDQVVPGKDRLLGTRTSSLLFGKSSVSFHPHLDPSTHLLQDRRHRRYCLGRPVARLCAKTSNGIRHPPDRSNPRGWVHDSTLRLSRIRLVEPRSHKLIKSESHPPPGCFHACSARLPLDGKSTTVSVQDGESGKTGWSHFHFFGGRRKRHRSIASSLGSSRAEFWFRARSLGRRRSDRSSCWQRSWYGSRGTGRICLAIPHVSGCNQTLQGHVELLGPGPTSVLRNFPCPLLSTHADSGMAYPCSCALTACGMYGSFYRVRSQER